MRRQSSFICKEWEKHGSCAWRDRCRYSHPELERPWSSHRADESTSFALSEQGTCQQATRGICREWQWSQSCPWGSSCRFHHPMPPPVDWLPPIRGEQEVQARTMRAWTNQGPLDGRQPMFHAVDLGAKRDAHARSKTRAEKRERQDVCREWERFGECSWKESCWFAHPPLEVLPVPAADDDDDELADGTTEGPLEDPNPTLNPDPNTAPNPNQPMEATMPGKAEPQPNESALEKETSELQGNRSKHRPAALPHAADKENFFTWQRAQRVQELLPQQAPAGQPFRGMAGLDSALQNSGDLTGSASAHPIPLGEELSHKTAVQGNGPSHLDALAGGQPPQPAPFRWGVYRGTAGEKNSLHSSYQQVRSSQKASQQLGRLGAVDSAERSAAAAAAAAAEEDDIPLRKRLSRKAQTFGSLKVRASVKQSPGFKEGAEPSRRPSSTETVPTMVRREPLDERSGQETLDGLSRASPDATAGSARAQGEAVMPMPEPGKVREGPGEEAMAGEDHPVMGAWPSGSAAHDSGMPSTDSPRGPPPGLAEPEQQKRGPAAVRRKSQSQGFILGLAALPRGRGGHGRGHQQQATQGQLHASKLALGQPHPQEGGGGGGPRLGSLGGAGPALRSDQSQESQPHVAPSRWLQRQDSLAQGGEAQKPRHETRVERGAPGAEEGPRTGVQTEKQTGEAEQPVQEGRGDLPQAAEPQTEGPGPSDARKAGIGERQLSGQRQRALKRAGPVEPTARGPNPPDLTNPGVLPPEGQGSGPPLVKQERFAEPQSTVSHIPRSQGWSPASSGQQGGGGLQMKGSERPFLKRQEAAEPQLQGLSPGDMGQSGANALPSEGSELPSVEGLKSAGPHQQGPSARDVTQAGVPGPETWGSDSLRLKRPGSAEGNTQPGKRKRPNAAARPAQSAAETARQADLDEPEFSDQEREPIRGGGEDLNCEELWHKLQEAMERRLSSVGIREEKVRADMRWLQGEAARIGLLRREGEAALQKGLAVQREEARERERLAAEREVAAEAMRRAADLAASEAASKLAALERRSRQVAAAEEAVAARERALAERTKRLEAWEAADRGAALRQLSAQRRPADGPLAGPPSEAAGTGCPREGATAGSPVAAAAGATGEDGPSGEGRADARRQVACGRSGPSSCFAQPMGDLGGGGGGGVAREGEADRDGGDRARGAPELGGEGSLREGEGGEGASSARGGVFLSLSALKAPKAEPWDFAANGEEPAHGGGSGAAPEGEERGNLRIAGSGGGNGLSGASSLSAGRFERREGPVGRVPKEEWDCSSIATGADAGRGSENKRARISGEIEPNSTQADPQPSQPGDSVAEGSYPTEGLGEGRPESTSAEANVSGTGVGDEMEVGETKAAGNRVGGRNVDETGGGEVGGAGGEREVVGKSGAGETKAGQAVGGGETKVDHVLQGRAEGEARPRQRKKVRRREPLEALLRQDAPELVASLRERGLLEDMQIYDYLSLDDEGDEAEGREGAGGHGREFEELERIVQKLYTEAANREVQSAMQQQLQGLLSSSTNRHKYCVENLAALIEQTKSVRRNGWPVSWGWCRRIKSFIFMFDRHNRIVVERPEYGSATYFFEVEAEVAVEWQVQRLIAVMGVPNVGRMAVLENRALTVGLDLSPGEASVLERYGWVPDSGLGSLLNFCDRLFHDYRSRPGDAEAFQLAIGEWKARIGKRLMDGVDLGRRTKAGPASRPKLERSEGGENV